MDDTWLQELKAIREKDKVKRAAPSQPKVVDVMEEASDLLNESQAHYLLRQVQKALLGGKGILKTYENTNGYTLALALLWQGPVSNATRPIKHNQPYYYIVVGVRDDKLWVNDHPIPAPTPDALKTALLAASKDPGTHVLKRTSS